MSAAVLPFTTAKTTQQEHPGEVRLVSLRLENFRAVRAGAYEFGRGDSAVYGANGSGKTTLADAWYWLLTGKDSLGRANAPIKTLTAAGDALHNLDHAVEAVISTPGGQFTLRRTMTERWTKKRGSATAEMTGHTTAYTVDGLPVSEHDWAESIAGLLAPEATIRLLSDPAEFTGRLPWQDRRRLLLEISGDATEAEVIASDPALRPLPELRGRHTVDEFRAILGASLKKANEELKQLPARLDEAQRGVESAEDAASLADAVEQATATLQAARAEEASLRATGSAGAAAAELQQAKATADRLAATRMAQQELALHHYTIQHRDASERVQKLESQVPSGARELERLQGSIASLDQQMAAERQRFTAVREQAITVAKVADRCPACEQPLPPDRVEAARVKATEQAALARSEALAAINQAGKRLRVMRDAEAERLAMVGAEQAKLLERLEAAREELGAINAPFATISAEETAAISRVRDLEAAMASGADAVGDERLAEVRSRIRTLEAELGALQRRHAEAEMAVRARVRVQELEMRQRQLAAEAETLLGHIALCERYVVARVALLESRLNSDFRTVRFKMFAQQINGGIAECCELLIGGVPYLGANHAGQINAGMECLAVLQQHFGVRLPVWVDGRESVSHLAAVDGQVISLVVSEADRKLRIAAAEE